MRRIVPVVLAILVALFAGLFVTSGFWVNWLWFGSLGLRSVLLTRYAAQWSLFAGGAILAGLFFAINLRHAARGLIAATPQELAVLQPAAGPELPPVTGMALPMVR